MARLFSRCDQSLQGMLDDSRRGIKRGKISICSLDGEIKRDDSEAVQAGVRLMLEQLGIKRFPLELTSALVDVRERLVATSYAAPRDVTAHRIFLTSQEMSFSHQDTNCIYGASLYPGVFISLSDLPQHTSIHRSRVISLLSAHEVGHLLGGLVDRNFNCDKTGHCNGETGPCIMQRHIIETIARVRDRLLCSDCLEHVAVNKDYLEEHMIYNS